MTSCPASSAREANQSAVPGRSHAPPRPLVEPLPGVLPDRLASSIGAQIESRLRGEALVEERLEGVGVGSGDLLRRLVGAATGEDGETPEEALLLLGEQVIRPLDRRAQGLLAGIGVALSL